MQAANSNHHHQSNSERASSSSSSSSAAAGAGEPPLSLGQRFLTSTTTNLNLNNLNNNNQTTSSNPLNTSSTSAFQMNSLPSSSGPSTTSNPSSSGLNQLISSQNQPRNNPMNSLVNSFVINPNPLSSKTISIPSTSAPSLPQPSGEKGNNIDVSSTNFPAQSMLSSSGFDVVGALVSMATRPNPKIQLGPIDLACAFVISDMRMTDQPIVYVSPTFEEMTGFNASEILGRNCRFLQHPTQDVHPGNQRLYTDHSVVTKIKQIILNREEGQFTLVNYKKTGEPFLNHVTMIPLRLGPQKTEVTHYIGLQIDLISQPKAIMQKMQNGTYSVNYQQDKAALQKKFENDDSPLDSLPLEAITPIAPNAKIPINVLLSFMEKVPDFIYVLSLRGLFLYVSPESCKNLLEWEGEELLGHKISEFVHPSDLVTVMRDLRNCSAEGTVNFICRMKRKNTGYMYMEMNGHVYNGSKRNRCFIISGREKPTLFLPHRSFYNPEADPTNETWLRTSPQGLILHCTPGASTFFQQEESAIVASSLFEWIDQSHHFALSHALSSTASETVQFTLNIQANVFVYVFRFLHANDTAGGTRWIQIKRDRPSLNPLILKSDLNLYHVIQSARSSSIYYECNKIRVRNSKLSEEIQNLCAN